MSSRDRKESRRKVLTPEEVSECVREIKKEEEARKKKLDEEAGNQARNQEHLKQKLRRDIEQRVRERFLYGARAAVQEKLNQLKAEHERHRKEVETARAIASTTKHVTRIRDTELIKQHGYNLLYTHAFKGSYWRTTTAKHKGRQETIALTIIDLDKCPKEKRENLEKEGFKIERFLSLNPHLTLVNSFDLFLFNNEYYIFHELMSYHLEKVVSNTPPVSEFKARVWSRELADAVAYLHRHGIAHRNICPRTVWFTRNLQIKLGNFSWCCIFFDSKTGRRINVPKIHAEEAEYHPPEEALLAHYEPDKADVWMWAATVTFVLTKRFPPKTGFKDFVDPALDVLSEDGRTLLGSCLQKDPRDRPTIASVLHDIWYHSLLLPMEPQQLPQQQFQAQEVPAGNSTPPVPESSE